MPGTVTLTAYLQRQRLRAHRSERCSGHRAGAVFERGGVIERGECFGLAPDAGIMVTVPKRGRLPEAPERIVVLGP